MKKTFIWVSAVILAAVTLFLVFFCTDLGKALNLFEVGEMQPVVQEQDAKEDPGDASLVMVEETYTNSQGQEWRIPETIEFSVSSGEKSVIKFWSGVIDPLKVHPGDIQNMKIVVSSETPIVSVKADIETDGGRQYVDLTKTGNEEGETIKEIWEGSWLVNDTSVRDYETIFTATDTAGNTKDLTLAWSDPCIMDDGKELAYTGNKNIDASCSISSSYGLDFGNLVILDGANVTIAGSAGSVATLAFNPGNSITNLGSITISNYAQIKKTYLWVKDADGDGYTTGLLSDRAYSDSAGSPPVAGYRRQAEMYNDYLSNNNLAVDCDDSDPSVPEPNTEWCDPYLYCSPYPYSATDSCSQVRSDVCSNVSSCTYTGYLCNCWTGKASRKQMLGGCGQDGRCLYQAVAGFPRMDENQCPDGLSYTWRPCDGEIKVE